MRTKPNHAGRSRGSAVTGFTQLLCPHRCHGTEELGLGNGGSGEQKRWKLGCAWSMSCSPGLSWWAGTWTFGLDNQSWAVMSLHEKVSGWELSRTTSKVSEAERKERKKHESKIAELKVWDSSCPLEPPPSSFLCSYRFQPILEP